MPLTLDLSWLLSGLLGVINVILVAIISNLHSRMTALEKEMHEIKLNYINRFDDARGHRNQMEKQILEALGGLQLENEKSHAAMAAEFTKQLTKR